MIPVTQPFLPPKEEFDTLVNDIWERNWLTNNGPLVNRLESEVKDYLGVDSFLYTGNGTIAIQIAIKALGISGEIITTPFSYVATTSSIIWEGCEPVFVDIDEHRFTLDPRCIEAAITERTSAILATHVYGLPCHVEEIEKIATKYNLKVIYDAAHAFGTKFKGQSLFNYGDISTLSTHATKLFHTIEGGGIVAANKDLLHQLHMMRNFGHNGPDKFDAVGINGKNSEFHAAMGIANLNHIEEILKRRKDQYKYYLVKLKNFNGEFARIPDHTDFNYAYFPIIFKDEQQLLETIKLLERNKIFCRRYFYPTLNSLNFVEHRGNTPIADRIAKTVLCLPLYHKLKKEDQNMIARLILKLQN